MSKIEAVLFDCDGVVVDSAGLQTQAELTAVSVFAEEHGLSLPDSIAWDQMVGWGRRQIAAQIFNIQDDSDLADLFRQAVVDRSVDIATEDNCPLIPGVRSFTGYMATLGFKVGLATSSNRSIYDKYCAINQIDFIPRELTVAFGEAQDNKPKPGPYLEVARRMNIDPKCSLVIEDSESGVTAARHAGATVLAIATTKPASYLRQRTDAHYVAQDFEEAAHFIRTHL